MSLQFQVGHMPNPNAKQVAQHPLIEGYDPWKPNEMMAILAADGYFNPF